MHPSPTAARLLGTTLVAMVTPMTPDGRVSGPDVESLVDHIVSGGCDGIVVAGTTGEAPTLTLDETMGLVRCVKRRAKGTARVIVGVGTNVTSGSVVAARAAQAAGADALLVVTPYYSRPSQAGIVAHCTAIADATDLPVVLYDIPARTGVPLTVETLRQLAQHPRIVAVKDAKGDLFEAMTLMGSTSLAYYCGIDELNLPYLASGATGVVTVTGNLMPARLTALVDAVRGGRLDEAREISADLAPLTESLMRPGPGAATTKATLVAAGVIECASVRLPLVAEPVPWTVLGRSRVGLDANLAAPGGVC